MNKLWLLFLFIVLLSGGVFAVNDSVVINSSVLPFNGSFDLSLSLVDGFSAYLFQDVFDSRVVLDFPSQVLFNGSSVVVPVDFVVDFVPNGPVNFSSRLVVTNDFNNLSFFYDLFFVVVGDDFFFVNDSFDITLFNDEYVVDVPDYLLPSSGVLDYMVRGLAGESLDVSCSGPWLTCPNESFFFGVDDMLSFGVDYLIPSDAVLGDYEFFVSLDTGSMVVNSSVFFNISTLGVNLLPYVWDLERCVNPSTGDIKYDCMVEYDQWNADRLTAFYERVKLLSGSDNVSFSNCSSVVATEYLVVGNVSLQASNLFDSCQVQLSDSRSAFSSLSSGFDNCSAGLVVCQDKLSDLQQGFIEDGFELCESSLLSTEFALQTCKDNIHKRNVRYWLITFLLSLIIGGVYYYFNFYKKVVWRF